MSNPSHIENTEHSDVEMSEPTSQINEEMDSLNEESSNSESMPEKSNVEDTNVEDTNVEDSNMEDTQEESSSI